MFVALKAFHGYAVCDMLRSMQCSLMVFPSRNHALSWLGALVIGWNVLVVSDTQAADGMLSSVSFSEIPSDANMVVEVFDDSDESIDLLETLTSALNSAGYVTSNNGAYLLIFEVHDEIGAYPRDQRHILSLETRGGRAPISVPTVMTYETPDSTMNPLVTPGLPPPPSGGAASSSQMSGVSKSNL